MALTQTQVSQLYVAIFNRASEGEGNTFWQKAGTKVEAANSMLDTQDAKDYFGTSINSNQAFIKTIYKNTLNKTLADDPAGIAFWTAALDSGMSRGKVVSDLIDAIESYKNATDPKTKAAYDQFNNRVQVSDYMAEQVTTAPADYKTSTQFAPLGTLNVDNTATSVSTAKNTVDNMIVIDGKTFALTAGADNFTGSEKNDVFNAYDVGDAVVKQTLNAVDQLDGGAGKDILNVSSDKPIAKVNANITNIETINLRSGDNVTFDTTNYTGVETLNVKQGIDIDATAGEKTDINVSGATGKIDVHGGKNVVVTDATAGQAITIGGTTVNNGTITVTDSNVGNANISIDGGTDVTLTTSKAIGGAIKVGDTTNANVAADMATGAIKITSNLESDGTGNVTGDTIDAEGGSSIAITVNNTTTAKVATADGNTLQSGAIAATAGDKTTDITVVQTSTNNVFTKAAIDGTKATADVKFIALATNESVTVEGLTFTASKALTAAEVAAAFANLTDSDTQSAIGTTANGYFTGSLNSGLTSGAVSSDKVTFTKTTATNGALTLAVSDTATANITATSVVTGVAGTAEDKSTSTNGYAAVTINDNATASIKTITVDGYANSTIGATANVNALTDLTLKNSAGTMGVTSTVASLNLNVDKVNNAVTLSDANLKTLNVAATGTKSAFALSATAVEALTVSGTTSLDLTSSTLTALKTVTVKETAGLTIDASGANVTAVDTTATTGTVTATVDASKATYKGGAGVDNVTLSSTTVDKAVNLGAGDDTLTLASGTTSLTAEMIAGDGTDTLVMTAVDAASASATNIFETKITGFEKLSVGASSSIKTVDLANMDDISYVVSAGTTGTSTATETSAITFQDLLAGQSVTVAGLTLTNTTGSTISAANVAAGFASLSAGATAGNPITDAVWSGALALWNTGTASTAAVTFTSTTANANVTNIVVSEAGVAAAATVGNGTFTDGDASTVEANIVWTAQALLKGQSLSIAGITVVAQKDLNAAQVASAFAADTVTSSAGNYTKIGTYSQPANFSNTTVASFTTTGTDIILTNASGTNASITSSTLTSTSSSLVAAPTAVTVVTTDGSGALTFDNMANNGTLELTGANTAGITVTMDDATGTADSFNIVTKVDASSLGFGTVAVAGVETINITATDISPKDANGAATIQTATLVVSDAAAKTVVITGESNLTLDTNSTVLTSVNASAMTGVLQYTADGATAGTIVTGGSGNDILIASGASDTLIGGAGNDTLTGANLTTLIGGDGNDTFKFAVPTNVNSYSTIKDLSSGDIIDLDSVNAGTVVFKAAGVTLASTAVFQDYANAAINSLGTDGNDATWFQFGGNTYIVQSGDTALNNDFQNGTDGIVQITGLVDLSTASYNQTNGTLEIA